MREIKPYNTPSDKKSQIEQMFNKISTTYDALNGIISFGRDKSWRKKVLRLVATQKPKDILDIATGTAEMAIALVNTKAESIVGVDISEGMIAVGKKKIKTQSLEHIVSLQIADGENLPFADESFDAITIGFGVRNFENLEKGLVEAHRVLRKGGKLVILETSVPSSAIVKKGYDIYTQHIMPKLGAIFSKEKTAYSYLSKSAHAFPHGKAFNTILENAGFRNITNYPQTFGVATIYSSIK